MKTLLLLLPLLTLTLRAQTITNVALTNWIEVTDTVYDHLGNVVKYTNYPNVTNISDVTSWSSDPTNATFTPLNWDGMSGQSNWFHAQWNWGYLSTDWIQTNVQWQFANLNFTIAPYHPVHQKDTILVIYTDTYPVLSLPVWPPPAAGANLNVERDSIYGWSGRIDYSNVQTNWPTNYLVFTNPPAHLIFSADSQSGMRPIYGEEFLFFFRTNIPHQ